MAARQVCPSGPESDDLAYLFGVNLMPNTAQEMKAAEIGRRGRESWLSVGANYYISYRRCQQIPGYGK